MIKVGLNRRHGAVLIDDENRAYIRIYIKSLCEVEFLFPRDVAKFSSGCNNDKHH